MQYLRLERIVMRDEGFRDRAYLDTSSPPVPTIGYGTTNILGRPVQIGDTITPTHARRLLRADLYQALVDAQALFERFDEMSAVRQEILTMMAYNLGRTRLSRFVRLRAAADELRYDLMAEEMMNSMWFFQVGERSRRLVDAMRHGEYRFGEDQ